jgi:GTPase SAR1 family protein
VSEIIIQGYGNVVGDHNVVRVIVQGEDVRDKERAYLNGLVSRYERWCERYTPLAGIAEVREAVDGGSLFDHADPFIPPEFEKLVEHGFGPRTEVRREPVDDLRTAIRAHRRIILLGDPGSGKTTTLWRLTYDYAEAAQEDPRAPLPVFVRLGEYISDEPFRDFLRRHLGPHLAADDVAREVTEVLDASIKALPYVIREDAPRYDLSTVDFDALRARFETGRKRTEAEKLRGTVHAKMQRMVRRNRTRIDYQAEYQRLIDEYNAGSANVEAHFNDLVAFAQKLKAEDARHLRENLTEEELAVFDILTKPPLNLTEAERAEVKAVAKDLLATLKRETLVLDWKKRQQYQASVRLAIEDMLYDRLPERYTAELCDRKRDDLYRHFYDNYQSGTEHIYAAG